MTQQVRAGVDIGGTFTDVVTVADGTVTTRKVPSTPAAPAAAVKNGLQRAAEAGAVRLPALRSLVHGTTVATNAVLEADWAETALITTEGFRDVLEIGRQARPDIYAHDATKPDPVVPRHRRHGVPERLDERGRTMTPLAPAEAEAVAAELDDDVESVAVSLLYSYEDDSHEQRVAEAVAAERDLPVSLSSGVLPEIREYERTLATALNAALRPVIDSYIERLASDLADLSPDAQLTIMGSNGGTMTPAAARDRPIETLLSGPAAGVRGAAHVAEAAGYEDLLTMDMGGTSCDVALVQDGEPAISTEVEVGDYPVAIPMVDVHTVGSGGGSIAWVDDGGALRVGPRSAGARPGPVCYGRGGERPTTTDAHALLGRIDPAHLFESPASDAAVETAMRQELAEPLEQSTTATASGVIEVANATLERALRVVSVEQGYDPRSLTLVAFGGAGPLHAAQLAAVLSIPRVLVPRAAGVCSALGLLVSDLVRDFSRSMVRPVEDIDATDLEGPFEALREEARDTLAAAEIPPDRRSFEHVLELRYEGQSFDLRVPVEHPVDEEAIATALDRFHDRHRDRYGHADPEEPVELVTVRLRARGLIEPPELEPPTGRGSLSAAVRTEREVVVAGEATETPVYDRGALPVGASFTGPAIVAGSESTILVPPAQRARVDEAGNVLIEVDG